MSRSRRPGKARRTRAWSAQASQALRDRNAARRLAAEVRKVNRAFARIGSVHRAEFPPAQRPQASLEPLNERTIRARHRKEALVGIAVSRRAERAAAKQSANALAQREIATERERLAWRRDAAQDRLDKTWAALGRNDPAAVLDALSESFENGEAPVAAVRVRGEEVELAVLVPGPASVPHQIPATQAGQTTLRAVTPVEHAAFYRELVAGHVLVTVRRAFAAAPGLASARVAALRESGADSYGVPTADCLMAARFTRDAFEGVRWSEADASRIAAETSSELLMTEDGAAKELRPIDLSARPVLAALVAEVNLSILTSTEPPVPQRAFRFAQLEERIRGYRRTLGPTLRRFQEVTVGWFADRRELVQRSVIGAVLAFFLLGVIGALAGTNNKPVDTAGRASSESAEPATTREIIDTTTSSSVAVPSTTAVPPTTVAPATVAEGVPAGGDDTTVDRIVDGDTLVVAGGTHIRLIGIDTPETADPGTPVQCFGPEATRYAKELLPSGTRVRLVYDVERLDRYRRTLAYVYKLDDGVFVNLAIARNGFAQQSTVPPNVAHAEEFRVAVAQARDADLGLWRGCQTATTPTPPPPPPVATAPPATSAPTTPATLAPRTTSAPSGGCHPSYAGACVPVGVYDVDCSGGTGDGPAYVSTKDFEVVANDVYGLDHDKDGIACESSR